MITYATQCTHVTYCTYCTVMVAWYDKVIRKLFTNPRIQSQLCMLYPLLQSWVVGDTGSLAPSRSPCATRNSTLVAQSVTRRRALVRAINGGTSTVLPRSGPQASGS